MSTLYPIPRQARRQDFVAAAGQTAFQPNTFKVYSPLDLRVRIKGVSGRFLTQTTGFIVALLGPAPSFPVVTFTTPRAAGDVVRIEGARTPERETDVTFGGVIRAANLEAELDKVAVFGQEVRRDFTDVADALDAVDEAVELIAGGTSAAGQAVAAAAEAKAGAEAARDAAVSSRDDAAGSAGGAAGSASAAGTARTAAEAARDAASSFQDAAAAAATGAVTARLGAEGANAAAQGANAAAQGANAAAQAAREQTEAARDTATQQSTSAGNSASAANTARSQAESARDQAQAASTNKVNRTGDTMSGALGAGDTTSVGPVAFYANASAHPSGSRRASINIGAYQIGQDIGSNGQKDFYWYNYERNSLPIYLDTSDVVRLSQRPLFGGVAPWDAGNLPVERIDGKVLCLDVSRPPYNVRPNGSDMRSAIQAALDTAGGMIDGRGFGAGMVAMPMGVLTLRDTLSIPSGVRLMGQGRQNTMLQMASDRQDRPIIYVGDTVLSGASDFGVRYDGGLPGLEQARGFLIQGNWGSYHNISAWNTGVAYAIIGGNNNLFHQFYAASYGLIGLLNQGTDTQQQDGSYRGAIDNFWVQGRLECPNVPGYAQNGTIRLINNCEGLNLDHISCLGGEWGIIADATTNTHGRRPQYMTITNTMIDSTHRGSKLEKCSQSRFSNIWFCGSGAQPGNNPEAGAYPGLDIGSECFDISLEGGWLNQNSGQGAIVRPGASDCRFNGVSVTTAGIKGNPIGLDIAGQNCVVAACIFKKSTPGHTQGNMTHSVVLRNTATNNLIVANMAMGGLLFENQNAGGGNVSQSNIGM